MRYLIPLLFLLSSCSSFYCRQCLKSGTLKTDSTSQTIKFKTPEVKADTTIDQQFGSLEFKGFHLDIDSLMNAQPDLFIMGHDTIYRDTGRAHLKILPGKKIFAECKCDPIVKDTTITKTIINTIETGVNPIRHWVVVISFLLIGLVVGTLIARISK